jgi:hypothetical protein
MFRKVSASGVEILTLTEADRSDTVEQLRAALALIAERLPGVFERVRSELRRIVVLPAGGPEFWEYPRAMALSHSYIDAAPVEYLAMVILHECTHARLWDLGFPYDPPVRWRIERICVTAELRLAATLPAAEVLSNFALASLEDPWWTKAKLAARRRRELTGWGAPAWILRAYDWVFLRS